MSGECELTCDGSFKGSELAVSRWIRSNTRCVMANYLEWHMVAEFESTWTRRTNSYVARQNL